MAKYKPLRVGPNYPFEQIQPGSDEIDGKIWVSQNAVVLGRTSAGAGPHQEIPISSLGGGGSYALITVADLQTAITNGTLTPGGAYLVTDASGFDGGFYTTAPTNNSINPSGVGIFLNADFQAVGDYSGVEGVTGIAAGTQRGIWRLGFEQVILPYTLLTPDYINYSGASGPLSDGEAYTTDVGHSGTIIHDDEAGTITLIPDQPLSPGEILTGSSSGNFVTVDSYTDLGFSAGDTITGNLSGAIATVVSDDGSNLVINVTSAGVVFDPSEMFDNGNGTVGGTTGAASSPDIQQGDIVIWNLLHWQLVDLSQVNGQNPADNSAAYTLLEKTVANVGYVTAYDVAEWDQVNNWLQYRADLQGNKYSYTKSIDDSGAALGYSALVDFQWGNTSKVYSNEINNARVSNKNINGYFFGNILEQTSAWYDNIVDETSGYFNNYQGINSFVDGCVFLETSNISAWNFSNGAVFEGCVFSGVTSYGNTLLQVSTINNLILQSGFFNYNILEPNASLTGITAGANCSISNNKIGQGGAFTGIELQDGAVINYNILSTGVNVQAITLGASSSIDGNVLFGELQNLTIGESCQVSNNNIESSGQITDIETGANCSISRNTIGQGATLGGGTVMGDGAKIEDCSVESSGYFGGMQIEAGGWIKFAIIKPGGFFQSNQMGSQSRALYNIIGTDATIQDCVFGVSALMNRNELTTSAGLVNIILGDGASFSNNKINAVYIQYKTIEPGFVFSENEIGVTMDVPEVITEDIVGKRAEPGYSDIPATIDITGLTTLDITAAWAQYRGIIYLTSSNPTETLDMIVNFPNLFPFQLRPQGFTLNVAGTPVSGIGAGQIALKQSSYALDGTNGEYIELEADPSNTYLIEKRVVNGIV